MLSPFSTLIAERPRYLGAAWAQSVAAALIGLALSASAAAQPTTMPPARGMTLEDAIGYAREHQPAVQAAVARIKASLADARATRSQWLPYVAAVAQLVGGTSNNTTTSNFTGGGVDLPRIGGTTVTAQGSLQPYPSTVAALGVTQQVFDFGRIAAQAAVDDATTDFEKLSAETAWLFVALGVEEGYFAVQAARSVLVASEEAYERSKVHRDLAKAGVDSGMRAPIDLTRSEADLARFDVGRVRARGGLFAAQAAFAAAVGIPENRLDALGAAPEPAQQPGLREAIDRAASRDPVIRAAAAQLKTQEAVTESIAAQLRPSLLLSGSFSGREGGAPPAVAAEAAPHGGWVPDIPNWDVALIFRVPIFDWVVWQRIDASRQREEVRKAELELVRQGQVAAVQQAWVGVDTAEKALVALAKELEAARANYDQADNRFRVGLGDIVDLTDAEALRTEAEIQMALGKFELARQRAVLARLIVENP